MSVVDDYLKMAYEALDSNDSAVIDKTARAIVATFQAKIPNLSHYRGSRIVSSPDPHKASDLRKLVGKLRVLRESEELERYGAYGLPKVTTSILELADPFTLRGNPEAARALCTKVDSIYANVVNDYTNGLKGWSPSDPIDDSEVVDQLNLRREKLEVYRDEEVRKIVVAQNSGVSVIANAEAAAQSQSSASISIDVTFEKIDDLSDDSLSEEDKTKLKGMLADLKTKGVGRRDSRLKKVQAWLADKGTDVFIAAMPYIVQLIQSQLGQ